MKTQQQLLEETRARITEVTTAQALEAFARKDGTVFLDVREPQEWNLGHIPGAVHVPLAQVQAQVEQAVPRGATVIVYCQSGNRSVWATDIMEQLGYTKVSSLRDGIRGWAYSGGEIED
ncbi:MAG TPA: rhodanese-like domain-containing protein [Gemmatimonadaceae bacterium]|nr:rhodanese-like domain-containing protein [Gemmatimonadaceae bacterium]